MAVNGANKAPGFVTRQLLKTFAYFEEVSGSTYKRLAGEDTVSLTQKPGENVEGTEKPKSWMQSIKDKFNEHFPSQTRKKVDGEDVTSETVVGWIRRKWTSVTDAFNKPYTEKLKKTETSDTSSATEEARGDK